MVSRSQLSRLWSKVHERERRHEGDGWGKPVAQLDQEWQSYLQGLVDEGVYVTVEEAERKVIAEYEQKRHESREDRP